MQDYAQGRKTAGAFGQSAAFGGTPQTAATGIFGTAPAATQPASSLFGAPATQPATNAFGAFGQTQPQAATTTPATGGAFGAFGQTQQPAQPATGFGIFGQGNQQQQPAGSIFGSTLNAPKPAFGTFGNTATTFGTGAFGQTAQQQPAATGLFGQTAQPQQATGFGAFGNTSNNATKPSIFGAATQPAAQTPGFGIFGNTQQQQQQQAQTGQQQQPAGGLFGGGLFGNQQAQQSQQQPQQGGLFGNTTTAQPAGGLFSTGTTGGLFGNQQQQQQNQQQAAPQSGFNMFNKPATPVGQTSLFGNFGQQSTNAAPSQQPSLFGNTLGQTATQAPANTGFGGSLFGKPSAPVAGPSNSIGGGNSLFGNSFGQTNSFNASTVPGAQGSLTASISQPIGANLPIFSMLPPGPRAVALDQQPKKKPGFFVDVPTRSPVPRLQLGYTPANTKLRGFGASASASTLGGGPGSSLTFSVGKSNALTLSKTLDTRAPVGPDAFLGRSSSPSLGSGSRQSVKKLILDKKVAPSDLFSKSCGSPGPLRGGGRVTFSPALSVAAREKEAADAASPTLITRTQSPTRNQRAAGRFTAHSTNHVLDSSKDSPGKDQATEPTELKEGDYWVKPDMKTLRQKGFDDLVAFKDLVVGRVGYGEVHFLEPVDLTGVRKLSQLFGEIVRFDDKECSVYPDSDEVDKPAPGMGLNVKARIVLVRCWANDKATREPITDEAHPAAVKHLKRLKNMKDTHFESFDISEGKWTFTVDHF
jgi:nuclear pore complex protein Nup98-Nup96